MYLQYNEMLSAVPYKISPTDPFLRSLFVKAVGCPEHNGHDDGIDQWQQASITERFFTNFCSGVIDEKFFRDTHLNLNADVGSRQGQPAPIPWTTT